MTQLYAANREFRMLITLTTSSILKILDYMDLIKWNGMSATGLMV